MTRKSTRASALALLIAVLIANFPCSVSQAAPVQWASADGGNNHFYEAILFSTPITWEDARSDALSKGGDLASITSEEENVFVFNLADSAEYWNSSAGIHNYGPWIGGFQVDNNSEPAGGWAWTDGSPWGFTAWASGQPDNAGVGEHNAHYFVPNLSRASTWNDWTGSGHLINSYVLEVVPEPSSIILMLCGLPLLWSKYLRKQ